MTNNIPPKPVFQIGEATLLASITAGYAALTLGLIALNENGYQPGDVISRKQLVASGIGVDLAKTIMNQFEGRENDKRKIRKSKKKNTGKSLSTADQESLNEIIDLLNTEDQEMKDVPSYRGNSQILFLIQSEPYNPDNYTNRVVYPEPSAVKELFANIQYANQSQPLDLSTYKAHNGRGRPSRLFVLPTPDKYAKLFGVKHPDRHEMKNMTSGHKTVKSFCDAIHKAWMENNQTGMSNQHAMIELSRIQGDSPKTLRKRNKRTGIRAKRNFFSYPINWTQCAGLIYKCRGGCWLELELPTSKLPGNPSFPQRTRSAPHYPVNKAGLNLAIEEWKEAGSPGEFYNHTRISGFDTNSYIFEN